MVYCSKCGQKNDSANQTCKECGSLLIKKEYFQKKNLNDFEDILTNENSLELEELNNKIYSQIIKNIKDMGKSRLNTNYCSTPLEKIRNIAGVYAKINYKSRGAELGSYAFNSIQIDDRLDESSQISTLIHELAHHLSSEIFEQLLMYVWGCEKSDALEAVVWLISMKERLNLLSDEYCAHTCEGRFIPHGYQNYGSFNIILTPIFKKQYDEKTIKAGIVFGNTIAQDIIEILEEFIDDKLRNEIRIQFKKDYRYPPTYDEILLESKEVLSSNEKIGYIIGMLKKGIVLAREENMTEILNEFKKGYEEVNETSH